MRGRISGLANDYFTRAKILTIALDPDENPAEWLDKYKDKDIDVTIKQYRQKRTLDANAYYWVLTTKLAKALGNTNARQHNLQLRRYGAVEIIADKAVYLVLPDTDDAEEKALEAETFHIKPTAQTKEGIDGDMYRTYMLMKGSHEYDREEMARLINGVVDECKAQGIETLPPAELERMLMTWNLKEFC